MKAFYQSFPIALKMIFTDPINFMLAIVPTVLALAVYILSIVGIYHNSDRFVSTFRGYIYTADQATVLAKILTGILIVFIFFLMSWTFVMVVGILAAPFNSLLSSRIEKILGHKPVTEDKSKSWREMMDGLGQTFKNEFKKILFIILMGAMAFVLNLFPLFYPVGLFIMSVLVAIQFVDYSWSRHEIKFGSCMGDVLKNILPYSLSGFLFLLLVTIPLINTLVPAFATSYYTVLWLQRQNKVILT